MTGIRLPKPKAPFQRLSIRGNSITLDTSGKVLVLPTENAAILPCFNESTLNPNRLTIAESPFGGLKGSGSPDYAPGTLYTPTDGVYLSDITGQNSTKTLTAGKLKELEYLTVDPAAHTITQEFTVRNDGENNPTVIDACNATTGWTLSLGTGDLSIENGRIKITATADSSGRVQIYKVFGAVLQGKDFLSVDYECSVASRARLVLTAGSTWSKFWDAVGRFGIVANTNTRFIFPPKAPAGTTNMLPSSYTGTYADNVSINIYIGFYGLSAGQSITAYVDNITTDIGKPAYVEAQVPDNLSATSLALYTHNGTAYQLASTHSLDGAYANISSTPANCTMADGIKFDDVYGEVGAGRAVYPKGAAGETKAGSSGTITYSNVAGTKNKIGLMVMLPPASGLFSQCRFKTVINYTDTQGNVVPDLSGNGNNGTIFGGVTKLNEGGLKFDGISGTVRFENKEDFDIGLSDFRVEVTIKTTDDSTHLFNKYTGWSILISAGKISALLYYGTTLLSQQATSVVNDGNIHHVVWDLDRDGFSTITIDGVSAATPVNVSSFVNADLQSSYQLVIGARATDITAFYAGDVLSASIIKNGICVLQLTPRVQHVGSTTHQFEDSINTSYGLQNLTKPWIALYDPSTSLIDFYLHTNRPQALSFKRDETGTIHELSLYPGNGQIYHGRITYADLSRDSDSDLIPDCLEASVNGSITNFLKNYGMVI